MFAKFLKNEPSPVVYSAVLKANPYKDAEGKFTSKEKAVHRTQAGHNLLEKNFVNKSVEQILGEALPEEDDRAEYKKAHDAQSFLWSHNQTTERLHSKNGDGTGGYTKERLKLHNQIVDHMLENVQDYISEGQPEFTIMGGRGGSGKSNFNVEKNPDVGIYDPKKTLVIDPDRIKELLPEYEPEKAAMVHKESSHVTQKLITRARALGANIALDVTMRSPVNGWVKQFKKDGYKVNAAFMHKPPVEAAISAVKRWNEGSTVTRLDGSVEHFAKGRLVPVEVVLGNKDNEKNFDALRKYSDTWTLYDHSEVGKFKKVDHYVKKFDEIEFTGGFIAVMKNNPYRDAEGKFTSKANAVGAHGDHETLVNAKVKVKQALPGSSVSGEKVYENSSGAQITKHVHQFYSSAKAVAGYASVVDAYEKAGMKEGSFANNLYPGEFYVEVKNSQLHVKTYQGAKKLADIGSMGPKSVHEAIPSLVKAKEQAKADSKAWVEKGSESMMALPGGKVMTIHKHQFYSNAKAQEGMNKLVKAYEDQGLVQNNGLLTYPGEFKVSMVNASAVQVAVMHAHKDIKQGEAPTTSPQAKEPAKAAPVPSVAPQKAVPKPEPKPEPVQSIAVPTPAPDAPVPPVMNSSLTEKGAHLYAHQSKAVSLLTAAIATGDMAVVKEQASAYASSYGASKYIKEYAESYLKYHEDMKAHLAKHSKGVDPEYAGLDVKAKKKAEAAVAEYADKHLALTTAAKNLAYEGKNSAAKSKAAPLITIEKKMVAAGMSAIDVAKVKAKATAALSEHEASLKAEYTQLMKDKADAKIEEGLKYYETGTGKHYELSKKIHALVASNQAALVTAIQGSDRAVSNHKAAIKAKAAIELQDAMAKLSNQSLSVSDLMEANKQAGQAEDMALKYGATMDQVAVWKKLGYAQGVGNSNMVPQTQGQALALTLSDYYALKYAKEQNAGKYKTTYNDPDVVSKAQLAELSAKMITSKGHFLKMGGNIDSISGDALKKYAKQAAIDYGQLHTNTAAALAEYKTKIADAYSEHVVSRNIGAGTAGKEKIAAIVAEAKAAGINDYAIQSALSKGKTKAETEMSALSGTASKKISDSAYQYEFAKQHQGEDSPDAKAAKVALDSTISVYGKHLSGVTPQDLHESSSLIVSSGKKMAEKMAELGATLPATIHSYDSQDSTFEYPAKWSKAGQFHTHQMKQVQSLDPADKKTLKSYTGSFYTPLNKAVGIYGTALMKGESPAPLDDKMVETMKALDTAFMKTKLGANVKLRRNMPSKYMWEQLGLTNTAGQAMTVEQAQKLVGKIYKETAYSSTSMKSSFGGAFSSAASQGVVTLRIRAGKDVPGIMVSSFSSVASEEEVVLGRGTTYVIRKITKDQHTGNFEVHVDALGMFPEGLK